LTIVLFICYTVIMYITTVSESLISGSCAGALGGKTRPPFRQRRAASLPLTWVSRAARAFSRYRLSTANYSPIIRMKRALLIDPPPPHYLASYAGLFGKYIYSFHGPHGRQNRASLGFRHGLSRSDRLAVWAFQYTQEWPRMWL
jgi:hypothetical protein